MVNTHLDYVQDGPNRLERGVPVADVLATEKEVRLSSIDKLLPSATVCSARAGRCCSPATSTSPRTSTAPSRLAGQRGAGRGGSARLLPRGAPRPRPRDPGNTWGGVAGSKGSPRRIDYAYVGGPVEVGSSEVVGEQGGDSVDRGYPKWTSDHRAVLSQLTVTPVPIPTTVALSSRMVTVGDEVTAYLPNAGGRRRRHGQADRPLVRVVRRDRAPRAPSR